MLVCALPAESANTITRKYFNFGHQSGYMYSRMDDAYFQDGAWNLKTGFLAYYTPEMPLVTDPYWKERTILMLPLYVEVFPSSRVALQAEITDLFVEFPYQSINNMGGKSPRFRTKIKLLGERAYLPATAFTVGVTFSSAKPYTIWENRLDYDSSNGLAGAGTGVADYLLLFTLSKTVKNTASVHARIGLAPLGSPVEYTHGPAQADEIPYGIAVKKEFGASWWAQGELSGMYNGLPGTKLAHYSVARLQVSRVIKSSTITLNLERGLTRETDTWVAGFYEKIDFRKK